MDVTSLRAHYSYLQGVIDKTRAQVEYAVQQPPMSDFLAQREVIFEQVTASLQALAYHEARQLRRRAQLEAMVAENGYCNLKKCRGILTIEERTGRGGLVVGLSLVCGRCGYRKYPSPEYAVCEQAEQFLDAAAKLSGTPPFPAAYSAFYACELYLRELGGFYYYTDESEEGEFEPPSDKHSLTNLRNRLPEDRRKRLDVKGSDGESFLLLLRKLPSGLWQFLRYQELVMAFPDAAKGAEPSISDDGRLLVNGTDIYDVLMRMGRILREFTVEEFRRNLL